MRLLRVEMWTFLSVKTSNIRFLQSSLVQLWTKPYLHKRPFSLPLGKIVNFVHGKNELWKSLDFRGIVPCRACDQVMSIRVFREHSDFMRVRTPTHSNTGRILPDSRSSKHMPHGPVSINIRSFHLSLWNFLPESKTEFSVVCLFTFFQNGCHSFSHGSKNF